MIKATTRYGFLALLFCGVSGTASAQQNAPSNPDQYGATQELAQSADSQQATYERRIKQDKLTSWRAEAIKMRTNDGGTLSAADRDYLQAKLDKINAN